MLTGLSLIFWDCTYELLLDNAAQVKSHPGSKRDPANPTWDLRWEWWDPALCNDVIFHVHIQKVLSHRMKEHEVYIPDNISQEAC